MDVYLDRLVAAKELHADSARELEREIKSLSQIRSRHVAEIFDLVLDASGKPAILIEEFVPGKSLADYAKTMPDNAFLNTMWQVASGTADIHEHKKIHRDLNPENILLDAENVLKILDFGLSLDENSAVTMRRRGTHHYAAPELLSGIPPVTLTPKCDVYSLGVLCWFVALKGDIPPFLARSSGVKGVKPKSIATVCPSLSADLASMIDKCVNEDPSTRPNARDLCNRLAREVLFDKHRAYISYGAQSQLISSSAREARIAVAGDAITIRYDGLAFRAVAVTGDVFINNQPVRVGESLPGSCVITLGRIDLGFNRTFVPIDMSHPGVVI